MGLDIVLSTNSGECEFKQQLTPNIIDVLKYLSENGYENEVNLLFGVDDFGKKLFRNQNDMISSVVKLLTEIESNNILPITYKIYIQEPSGSGNYEEGGWMVSGLKIDGYEYSLMVELGKCEMRRKWVDNDGKIKVDKPIDVSMQDVIKTDADCPIGDVLIKKSRKPTDLKKILINIKDYLESVNSENIYLLIG